ncbi:MAG TPA: GDSL-type esterase/lipase family protein [Anaerovoracaceae bacterium]|nr:GDSL-type esterase/lipase family protein [Anaerovoracaceae bacterium]
MKIICMGDSLTMGYGIKKEDTWIQVLNDKKIHEFINKGINGDTTGGMLSRYYRDVLDLKPNYVLILGGINDFIMGETIGAVKANLMSMVHQSYHYRIIPVVLTPIMGNYENIRADWRSITDFERVQETLKEYQSWLKQFSKVFKVCYIDLYEEFAEHKLRENILEVFLDGLHPNPTGQEMMAKIIGKHFF